MIQQIVHIHHLMGGDYHAALIAHVHGQRPPELPLARDVQPIGRLVHEQQSHVGGKSEREQHFLALPHRQPRKRDIAVKLESIEIALHIVTAELGVERSVAINESRQPHFRQRKLLAHEKHVGQHIAPPQTGIDPAKLHTSGRWGKQAGYQVEQRGLARPVPPQQTAHDAAAKLHRKI